MVLSKGSPILKTEFNYAKNCRVLRESRGAESVTARAGPPLWRRVFPKLLG